VAAALVAAWRRRRQPPAPWLAAALHSLRQGIEPLEGAVSPDRRYVVLVAPREVRMSHRINAGAPG
jgi:hypothetical protein